MRKPITATLDDRSGTTAVEYGLIAALIMLTVLASVTAIGTQISTILSNLANFIQNAPAQ